MIHRSLKFTVSAFVLLFLTFSLWSVAPTLAVTDWAVTYTGPISANVNVIGTTVTIGASPNCGKAIFTYGYNGLLGDLDALGIVVDIVSGQPASVYLNIYLDNGDDGAYPTGRFYDERLDYTFNISPGNNNLDAFSVTGGSAIRNIANDAPTGNTVDSNYTLAQAKSDNPGARIVIALNIGDTGTLGCNFNGTFSGATVEGTGFVPASATSKSDRFEFKDGRINRFRMATPIAVYPYTDENGDKGLQVYGINEADGKGFELLTITPAMIAGIPETPEQNTLITNSPLKNMSFYRLSGGEFQFNAYFDNGKMYVLIFNVIGSNVEYQDFEVDPVDPASF